MTRTEWPTDARSETSRDDPSFARSLLQARDATGPATAPTHPWPPPLPSREPHPPEIPHDDDDQDDGIGHSLKLRGLHAAALRRRLNELA